MILRTIPILAALLLCAPTVRGQQDRIDSLRAVIAADPTDTSAIHARLKLCIELRRAGDTAYWDLLDTTISLATIARMHSIHGRALLERGQLLMAQGRTSEALEQFRAAEALAAAQDLHHDQGEAVMLIAMLHSMRSEHAAALEACDRALSILEELGLPRLQAAMWFQQGIILGNLGRYEESISRFMESLVIFESIADSVLTGLTLNNLGDAYEQFSHPGEALGFYQRALEHMRHSHSSQGTATVLFNIGRMHRQLGNLDSALHYMRAGVAEVEATSEQPTQAFGLMLHGEELEAMGHLAEAEIALRRALGIFREIGSRQYESQILDRLAKVVTSLGRRQEGIALAERALNAARETGTAHETLDAHKLLARLYEDGGDTGRALYHHKTYAALKDSLVSLESAAVLDELRIRYETEKKDRQLVQQELRLAEGQAALERRGKLLWALGLGVAAISVVLLLVVRLAKVRLQATEREKEVATARAVLAGEERERQRVARELHDGIGVLLSSALMHQQNNDNTRAAHLMEEACTEVRRISHAMMPGSLARFGLVKALEELARNTSLNEGLYVRVQGFGMHQRLPPHTETAVFRIAQEAVNNAIKHARAHAITVDLSQEDGRLHLVVADDGIGFDPAQAGQGNGLGHIRARAELLGGDAEWRSTPGHGTIWEVWAPLARTEDG